MSIDVDLTCRIPARPCRAKMYDISHDGCRLKAPGARIELGGTAMIELPALAAISGQVVWTQGDLAGIRFNRPLNSRVAVALGLAQPEEAAPTDEATVADEGLSLGGLLHHWVRRLVGFPSRS